MSNLTVNNVFSNPVLLKKYGLEKRGQDHPKWDDNKLKIWIRLWDYNILYPDRDVFVLPALQDAAIDKCRDIVKGSILTANLPSKLFEDNKGDIDALDDGWYALNKDLFGAYLDDKGAPIDPFANAKRKAPPAGAAPPAPKKQKVGQGAFDDIDIEEVKEDEGTLDGLNDWLTKEWEAIKTAYVGDIAMAVAVLLCILLNARRASWMVFIVLASQPFANKVFNIINELENIKGIGALLVSLNPIFVKVGLQYKKGWDGIWDIFALESAKPLARFIAQFRPLKEVIRVDKKDYPTKMRGDVVSFVKGVWAAVLSQGKWKERREELYKLIGNMVDINGYWSKKKDRLSKQELQRMLADTSNYGVYNYIFIYIYI